MCLPGEAAQGRIPEQGLKDVRRAAGTPVSSTVVTPIPASAAPYKLRFPGQSDPQIGVRPRILYFLVIVPR